MIGWVGGDLVESSILLSLVVGNFRVSGFLVVSFGGRGELDDKILLLVGVTGVRRHSEITIPVAVPDNSGIPFYYKRDSS